MKPTKGKRFPLAPKGKRFWYPERARFPVCPDCLAEMHWNVDRWRCFDCNPEAPENLNA